MKTVKMEVELKFNEKTMPGQNEFRNFLKSLFDRDLCLTDEVEEVGTVEIKSVYLPSTDKNRQWSQLPLELNN